MSCRVHNSPVLVWRKNDSNFNPPLVFSIFDVVGSSKATLDGIFVANLTIKTDEVTESILRFNFVNFAIVSISCGNVNTGLLNTCLITRQGMCSAVANLIIP